MLGIESVYVLLNVIIGLPLVVLFIKAHTILIVVKPKFWPPSSIYVGAIFILLFYLVYWVFSNFLTLGEETLSKITLLEVGISAVPPALLVYFIFEVTNKIFFQNDNHQEADNED